MGLRTVLRNKGSDCVEEAAKPADCGGRPSTDREQHLEGPPTEDHQRVLRASTEGGGGGPLRDALCFSNWTPCTSMGSVPCAGDL